MSLLDRVKNILLKPNDEWDVIREEDTDTQGLFVGYVIPLAAVQQICAAIGLAMVGISVPFLGSIRYSMGDALMSAIVGLVMAVVMVFILGLVINALAENFDGQKNQIQALKLAGYSYTPAWVAGIFSIIPSLSFLGLIGSLYGLYLLYLGIPKMMNAPKEKSVMYTIVVIVVAIIVMIVVGMITALIVPNPATRGLSGLTM